MSYQPFLVADFRTGLDLDTSAWLLPKDAFQFILNGYIHHGVLHKRNGMELLGRMVHWETTVTAITAANPGVVTVASAVNLSEGQEVQISYAIGGTFTSLNGVTVIVTNLVGNDFELYDTDGATIDTSAYGVYGGGGVLCIFPELPIMGIKQFFSTPFARDSLIWDTRRAAIYNTSTMTYDPLDIADIFTGDNTNFISIGTFGIRTGATTPILYFTNFNGDATSAIDNMRSFINGATTTTAFVPDSNPTGAANLIRAAQFMQPLKQRLILFNTIEGGAGTQYPQRMRWSRSGDPATWDDVTPGNGGYVDAPTAERIIGLQPLQDRIVVFFSQSVWTVEPTSDPALPFRWKKSNSFRASDAPYSSIAHDKYVISLGFRGIFASDGVETVRIDDKIQDFVIEQFNLDSIRRVFSERNFAAKRTWILYPSATVDDGAVEAETSNRALVRTDDEGSWSIYTTEVDDGTGTLQNLSCLGFSENSKDYLYSDFDGVIQPDYSYAEFGDETYASYFTQLDAELFAGGDHFGRIFSLEKGGNDNGADIDFEVVSAAWNPFKEQGASAQLGYMDIYADADMSTELTVDFFADTLDTPYKSQKVHLLREQGFIGIIEGITQANPAVVSFFDHGLSTGDTIYLYGMTGMIEIQGGPYVITVIDTNSFSLDGIDSSAFSAYEGNGYVTKSRFSSTKVWKRVYAGGIGFEHFVRITSSGQNQIVNLHALRPWFRTVSKRAIQ